MGSMKGLNQILEAGSGKGSGSKRHFYLVPLADIAHIHTAQKYHVFLRNLLGKHLFQRLRFHCAHLRLEICHIYLRTSDEIGSGKIITKIGNQQAHGRINPGR